MGHRLTLVNTLHPHKLSRTASWYAPNGQVHNQVDSILKPQRLKSSIDKTNTRSFRSADIGSDGDIVLTIVKFKLKTKRFTKSPRILFDLKKLKDPKIAEVFQATIGRKFEVLSVLESDVDTLLSTAEEVLGRQRKKIQPRVTNQVMDLCDQRRQLKYLTFPTNALPQTFLKKREKFRKNPRTIQGHVTWINLKKNFQIHFFLNMRINIATP